MDDPEDLHDVELVDLMLEIDDDSLTDWELEFRAHIEERMTEGNYNLSDLQRDKAVQMIRFKGGKA